jgi:hypothetical protein
MFLLSLYERYVEHTYNRFVFELLITSLTQLKFNYLHVLFACVLYLQVYYRLFRLIYRNVVLKTFVQITFHIDFAL